MASVADSPNRLFWMIVLALFVPFLAEGIEFGFCSQEFWINLVLSLLVPFCGFIHAVYTLVHVRYSRRPSRSGYESVSDGSDPEQGSQQAAAVPALTAPAAPASKVQAAEPPHGSALPQASKQNSQTATSASHNPEGAASAHAPVSQPPPYTPGNVVTFDNKIQRS